MRESNPPDYLSQSICHALPQLYHHHGSEEKRGVSGFSPLAQYHHMTLTIREVSALCPQSVRSRNR
ncbi:hypothetical protein CPZ13_00200 [Lacticaseibacillus paracasei]|nr:hypothetical protein CPZ14_00210 [Lacticaseibacillus paracasei]PCL35269.1 hypothetical protein CPZ13_00200 [Lacticaseibacillus paracasei]